MSIQQIHEAREVFGIDEWGAGYFGIDDKGNITCHPEKLSNCSIPIIDVVKRCNAANIRTPLIIRFPQIISGQLDALHSAFGKAVQEYSYKGKHRGVFPFKVNQRKEFIDSVVETGKKYSYGLEVGSKPEFVAALSYELGPDAHLICNGFKDNEFIEMAFIAKAMGKNVTLVVEGTDELFSIMSFAAKEPLCPDIGLRIRLYSKGSGKWEKSSGDSSKFGLTTIEVLDALRILESNNMVDKLKMLHFHIGSQITDIKRFKTALKEAARVYAKIYSSGFAPENLNIGGGVGVDYDGSKTSYQSSANYSMQEFANDAVYVVGEVCNEESVPHPNIITESGRVIAAYHSVVITDIREVQGEEITSNVSHDDIDSTDSEGYKGLMELKYILDNINRKNYNESYHDAIEFREELYTLFNLGYLSLAERGAAEELFQKICRKTLYFSSFESRQNDEFQNLQKKMVSKYLANFSIFQSIPDTWSIEQLFPVLPISRHHERPSHKATIVDITCDSDGCIDRFIDKREIKPVLDLHSPNGEPYYIGFFLVGAYQESLANEHNLFGAINEVEVVGHSDGKWEVTETTPGDLIDELLESRNYNIGEILEAYEVQLKLAQDSNVIDERTRQRYSAYMKKMIRAYPYLADLS